MPLSKRVLIGFLRCLLLLLPPVSDASEASESSLRFTFAPGSTQALLDDKSDYAGRTNAAAAQRLATLLRRYGAHEDFIWLVPVRDGDLARQRVIGILSLLKVGGRPSIMAGDSVTGNWVELRTRSAGRADDRRCDWWLEVADPLLPPALDRGTGNKVSLAFAPGRPVPVPAGALFRVTSAVVDKNLTVAATDATPSPLGAWRDDSRRPLTLEVRGARTSEAEVERSDTPYTRGTDKPADWSGDLQRVAPCGFHLEAIS